MILEQIKGLEDLKKLTSEELSQLAEEIRAFLIEKISHTGGHLASNLGVVELTIALFRTFDLPEDTSRSSPRTSSCWRCSMRTRSPLR